MRECASALVCVPARALARACVCVCVYVFKNLQRKRTCTVLLPVQLRGQPSSDQCQQLYFTMIISVYITTTTCNECSFLRTTVNLVTSRLERNLDSSWLSEQCQLTQASGSGPGPGSKLQRLGQFQTVHFSTLTDRVVGGT